jgi:hypothetical protein
MLAHCHAQLGRVLLYQLRPPAADPPHPTPTPAPPPASRCTAFKGSRAGLQSCKKAAASATTASCTKGGLPRIGGMQSGLHSHHAMLSLKR